MKRNTIWAALAFSVVLGGCGSDDSASTPTPPQPKPPVDKPEYVFGGPSEDEKKLNKVIQLAIVKGFSPLDQAHTPVSVNAQYVSNIAVDGVIHSKMDEQAAKKGLKIDYLLPPTAINMAGVKIDSIRPDLFAEGKGSVLDLLMWVGKKYDLDIQVEKDDALNTYFVTSIEGVQGLPEAVDPDHIGETLGQGWKYLVGPSSWEKKEGGWDTDSLYYKEEEIYFRMDHQPLKNEMSIVLVPAQPGEMEIRKRKYRREMQRLAGNGGKVIIPEIVIDFKPAKYSATGEILEPNKRAVFKNIEVTPHNLRTDLYQPGVITELDAWLSLVEQRPDLKIDWSYWPRLSTNANVQGYVATAISFNGRDDLGNIVNETYTNNGACGFVHHTGEWENYMDSGAQHGLYQKVMCSARLDMGGDEFRAACMNKVPGVLGYRAHHYGAGEQYENHNPKGRGYMKFGLPFGGNDPHLTGDAMIIYGPEYINYIGAAFSNKYGNQQASSGCDADAPEIDPSRIKDVSKARAPLTESHFGWKLPDCSTCHNAANSHVVEEMAPWECAECHGNNGAPDSHGELLTCGFCHAQTLEKHGDAYSTKDDYYSEKTKFKEPESCLTCHVDKPSSIE
ncbi:MULTISPECIES: cytochrome c3 family protein [Ferrimonas]|uniref:cytochrome c3 family protein n=1 Tax=Ferrimonas TaxID=44011 RepID=UPI00041D30C7|nr:MULTISPECIES: cytochrome c3 family protein [Ferrimonas]USD39085.1 cytochrome c3 family protein [Ferrimonas sp. SCSIO 43195]